QEHQYISEQLQERAEMLLPDWPAAEIENLVQHLITVLNIFIVKSNPEKAVEYCDKIMHKYFPALETSPSIILNAILQSRYILLSALTKNASASMNSLVRFAKINDLFRPFTIKAQKQYGMHEEDVRELLPQNFEGANELTLSSFDFAGLGVFMLDKQFNFIYWSDRMERLYNVPAQNVLGKYFGAKLQLLQVEKEIYDALRFAIENGVYSELISTRHTIGEDRERFVNFKISPLRNEKGSVIGASALVKDMTERREKDLTLQKYEQYFENILNDAADAIIILDENDRIAMWNKAAERIYGWRENEVLGKPVSIIVPDDRISQREIEKISRIVRKRGYIRNFRSRRLTRFGKRVIIKISRSAIRNDEGEYIGSSIIARDITREEQLRAQLSQSEKLSAVGTLAAGIAHEVGSPLTSISSLTQMLQLDVQDQNVKEKLSLIQEFIDRIARTVRTLVDFSKPIAQKVENIYLNHVIDHVIQIIKYDKRLKHQEIETALEPHIPLVKASFDQVLQVFINLCLNAADAMECRDKGHLKIKTWYNETGVFASVTDNGCGISKENIPHIFEPFYTTKQHGKGTGLGLWVSYNIIKSFGGEITLETKETAATQFTISLPAVRQKKE
ncbi:MAG: PAS domain S-box protein, partial [Calditrichaeota bacterium]|nr:PAS domain S-box protein [Calditrichota bacterium]